jgi:hypothetical protein
MCPWVPLVKPGDTEKQAKSEENQWSDRLCLLCPFGGQFATIPSLPTTFGSAHDRGQTLFLLLLLSKDSRDSRDSRPILCGFLLCPFVSLVSLRAVFTPSSLVRSGIKPCSIAPPNAHAGSNLSRSPPSRRGCRAGNVHRGRGPVPDPHTRAAAPVTYTADEVLFLIRTRGLPRRELRGALPTAFQRFSV